MSPISAEDLQVKSGANIYEVVIAAAWAARKINNRRRDHPDATVRSNDRAVQDAIERIAGGKIRVIYPVDLSESEMEE